MLWTFPCVVAAWPPEPGEGVAVLCALPGAAGAREREPGVARCVAPPCVERPLARPDTPLVDREGAEPWLLECDLVDFDDAGEEPLA